MITLLILAVFEGLSYILPRKLHSPIISLIWVIFGRILLGLLGFFYINTTNLTPISNPPPIKISRTLVISNHISWIDIIYVATFISQQIIICDDEGFVQVVTPLCAIYYSLSGKYPKMRTSFNKLLNMTDVRTLVMFPESTTSNGQGLLKLCPVFEG